MTDKNKPPTSLNPAYVKIREQIRTESIIFKQKGDLYATALTLTAEDCFEKGYLQRNALGLIRQIELLVTGKDSLSLYKEAGMAYHLAKKQNIKNISGIKEYLEKTLAKVGASRMPPQILGSVAYFLKQHDATLKIFNVFQTSLINKLDDLINKGNLNAVIDLSVGIKNMRAQQCKWLSEQSLKALDRCSLERVAKLTVIFPKETSYWKKLEQLTNENNGTSSIYPDIAFSLFEAQKIINSNIPGASLKNILSELKKVDSSWSRLITDMEAQSITIDATELHQLPNFSPHQDVWILLGLLEAGRAKTVQVNEGDYQGYLYYAGWQDKGCAIMNKKSFVALILLATAYAAYVGALFQMSEMGLRETIADLSLDNFTNMDGIRMILQNPWWQFVIGMLWMFIFCWRLISRGKITFWQIIISWPMLFPFYKLLQWIIHMAKGE